MNETITVVGNITQPEYKVTAAGVPILNFRIASTVRRFDRGEEKWVDGATNWFSVSVFRQLAEHANRSLRKGDRVLVTGRLRLRDWETAAKKGVTAEIDADALGHDLLWGMTTFHRDGGPGRVSAPAQDPEWGVPGDDRRAEGEASSEWPVAAIGDTPAQQPDGPRGDGADEPELVSAGAHTDTPF
ncbi:MAG: single-stranded DNA-binding protein [Microbacterium sp.]|uniref:single-stranded DNA-binding protein n=1 Tax=Microbacterium sp. TaxID=51671 RepID=UPI0039E66036